MGEAAPPHPEQAPPGVRKAFPTYLLKAAFGRGPPAAWEKPPPRGAQLDLDDGPRDRSGSYLCRWSRPPRCLLTCLADELHLVVAPFFVGVSDAPRFVSDARFPFDAAHRMTLAEVPQIRSWR